MIVACFVFLPLYWCLSLSNLPAGMLGIIFLVNPTWDWFERWTLSKIAFVIVGILFGWITLLLSLSIAHSEYRESMRIMH